MGEAKVVPELTEDELRHVRKLLDDDEKMKWLWISIRKWSAFVAGGLAAWVMFRNDVVKIFLGGSQ